MAFEKVQISRNGADTTFDAYLLGKEGAPGVVVIQEWWGVDYEIKHHAETIAAKGYRCLIPDLYRGKVALEVAEAQHLMEGLDWPGAVADIGASAKWLKDHSASKVGVIGFCMGGALSIASAVRVDAIDAAVAFYGSPPAELADPKQAHVPVQGHFGAEDTFKGFADPETAKALGEKFDAAGVTNEIHIYDGCGHAFMNSSEEGIKRKESMSLPPHNQEAVDTAWSRSFAWFSKYLN